MSVVIDGTTGIDTIEPTIVPAALNATGSTPIYACRAWVNFNGEGAVAIRASGNVSSLIDVAIGRYTINFTTDMPDANYSTVVTCNQTMSNTSQNIACGIDDTGTTTSPVGASLYTTSAVRVSIQASDGGNEDMPNVMVVVFR